MRSWTLGQGLGWAQAFPPSTSMLNRSPSKLQLDPSLPIKVLSRRCPSQTLFQLVSPEHLRSGPF